MGFLSNLGTAPFTLGYNFCFLTYYVAASPLPHAQKQVDRAQQPRTLATTKKSIFAVCLVYLLFSVPATVVYGSVRDADGNLSIPANLVKALPPASLCGAGIYLLMWLSCVCSMPVLLASTAEVVEKNCPQGDRSFFVRDKGRLLSRLAQILLLAIIAYLVPFFGEVINIYILRFARHCLLHPTRRIRLRRHLHPDPCRHPFLRVQNHSHTEAENCSFCSRSRRFHPHGGGHLLLYCYAYPEYAWLVSSCLYDTRFGVPREFRIGLCFALNRTSGIMSFRDINAGKKGNAYSSVSGRVVLSRKRGSDA